MNRNWYKMAQIDSVGIIMVKFKSLGILKNLLSHWNNHLLGSRRGQVRIACGKWNQLRFNPNLELFNLCDLVRKCLIAAVVATCVWGPSVGGLALAQPVTPDSSPEQMLADQLMILAKESLGGQGEPRSDQFVRAQLLMDLALELAASDAQAWQLRAELAVSMDDRPGQLRALSRYCSLRPQDDAAQLKWIMGSIRNFQTVENQISAAEKILDAPQSKKLSAALRSRLNSFVAQSALELGDPSRFTSCLKEAVRLDATNQQAARMMLDLHLARGADAMTIGQALILLVSADPTNPIPRIQFAKLLFSQRAYAAAAQQYEAAYQLGQGDPDNQSMYSWVHSLAASGRLEDALTRLSHFEVMLRKAETQTAQPTTPSGAFVGLPLDLELLRLTLLHQSGRKARTGGSLQRIKNLLQDKLQAGDVQAETDLVWLGLLMDQAVPSTKVLERLVSTREPNDPIGARLTAWTHLRAGDLLAAKKAFDLSPGRDPFAVYGRTKFSKNQKDPDRLKMLQEVVALEPENLAGLMAACDLFAASDRPQSSENGARLSRLIESGPKQLIFPDPRQDPWMTLSIRVKKNRYSYLEAISAWITLRNTTNFPLSLGPDQSVPSKLLLRTSVRQGGAFMGPIPPVIVDAHQRLRLPPRSSLEIETRLDRSGLGAVLAMSPIWLIGIDVAAVLGPRFDIHGALVTHPFGASGSVYLISRAGSTITMGQVDHWIAMIQDTDPIRHMLAAAWLLRVSAMLDYSDSAQEFLEKIVPAVNNAYNQLSPMSQAWVIRFLPTDDEGQKRFEPIHEFAQRSDDPYIRLIYATTQVNYSQAAVIDSMLRDQDTTIVAFGRALRTGLLAAEKLDEPAAN